MALTHVTHRTGLVMPVKAIAAAAREHAVDVILDGPMHWARSSSISKTWASPSRATTCTNGSARR